jgi:hypothetical protein
LAEELPVERCRKHRFFELEVGGAGIRDTDNATCLLHQRLE